MEKPLKIRQIRKTKIYKDIVNQLKTLILSGRLKEGNRLPTEREFAKQFGVSRVTVRQALTVLHEMGFVESRPGGGTFVSQGIRERILNPITATLLAEKELLDEPLEVRNLIEPQITRLAALRATGKNIRELERILTLQESKAHDGLPITEEDTLFHEAIAKSAGNSILIKLIQSLHHHLRASREQSLMTPSGNQRSISDHREIVAAIASKNSQAAYNAMVKHLSNVEQLISQSLKKAKAV
jgi:GntR family transcriptional repressor for pyruvate dehydrogenase complex